MTAPEFAALAVAQLLSLSRLLQATKAAWGFIPPKYQWLPAFVLTAATEVAAKLQSGVASWMDVVAPVLLVLSTLAPGARSNVHVAVDGALEKISNDASASVFSATSYRRLTRGRATPGTAVMMVLLIFTLPLAGCSMRQLNAAQTAVDELASETASLVAEASNALSIVEQEAALLFAKDPSAREKFTALDQNARRVLEALSKVSDRKALDDELAEFREAYSQLEDFAKSLNLFPMTPGARASFFPLPRAALARGATK